MILPLFTETSLRNIHDHDGILQYQENYLSPSMTLERICEHIVWRNDFISMFGKVHPLPRLTAWHGDPGVEHTYSKIKMISPGWTPVLEKMRDQLYTDFNLSFNSVLINYYRDGNDHMSYHADDEQDLGINPTIASLSIGALRKFHLKHRFDKSLPTSIFELESHSLLMMKGELQYFWLHKISKSTKVREPRLNLTFRQIIQ